MEARVLWAHTSEVAAEFLSRCRGWIQPEEWTELSNTRSPSALQDRILARGLLRVALGRDLGWEPGSVAFRKDPQGKLHLQAKPTTGLEFSLTHTGGAAACVTFRGGKCGIDLERVDRALPPESTQNRFLTPGERAFLDSLPQGERPTAFLRLWTLKEAYMKAAGVGLGVSPGKIGVTPSEADPGMSFFQLQLPPSWIGAIAADGTERTLRVECVKAEGLLFEDGSAKITAIPSPSPSP